MAYKQEAAKQIREELRRQLPPEVFEDEVAEKKDVWRFGIYGAWEDVHLCQWT